MDQTQLIAVGGHPAVALLNSTAQLRQDEPRIELLDDGFGLLDWLSATGLLSDSETDFLQRRYSTRTLDQLARDAVELREWWRGSLAHVLSDATHTTDILEHINELLALSNNYSRLEDTADGIVLTPIRRWTKPASVLAPIAEAIADLIESTSQHLIRKCKNPACTLFFYDRTKAHRRRWCSMAVCGNRAKARAHRNRQRDQTAQANQH